MASRPLKSLSQRSVSRLTNEVLEHRRDAGDTDCLKRKVDVDRVSAVTRGWQGVCPHESYGLALSVPSPAGKRKKASIENKPMD